MNKKLKTMCHRSVFKAKGESPKESSRQGVKYLRHWPADAQLMDWLNKSPRYIHSEYYSCKTKSDRDDVCDRLNIPKFRDLIEYEVWDIIPEDKFSDIYDKDN